MGRATSKDNEAKSGMKQPSDMPMPSFEHGGSDLWSNTLPLEHGGAGNIYTNKLNNIVEGQH